MVSLTDEELNKLRVIVREAAHPDAGYCTVLLHTHWREVGAMLEKLLADRDWMARRVAAQSERIEWVTDQNAELVELVRKLQAHMNEGAQP